MFYKKKYLLSMKQIFLNPNQEFTQARLKIHVWLLFRDLSKESLQKKRKKIY